MSSAYSLSLGEDAVNAAWGTASLAKPVESTLGFKIHAPTKTKIVTNRNCFMIDFGSQPTVPRMGFRRSVLPTHRFHFGEWPSKARLTALKGSHLFRWFASAPFRGADPLEFCGFIASTHAIFKDAKLYITKYTIGLPKIQTDQENTERIPSIA